MATETEITKRIVKELRSRGAYVLKIHGSEMQPKSIDLVACLGGQFIGIEVKRPGKHPTERQQFTLDKIKAARGWAFTATSAKDLKPVNLLGIQTSMEGIPILNSRKEKALASLQKGIAFLDVEFVIMVATEIGLESCVTLVDGNSVEFDLTDLQVVALAAALKACIEIRNSG